MTTKCTVFCWLAIFALIGSPNLAQAFHPYHVSRAEINWNPTTGNFEVALCVWPADLEKALALQQGSPVDLDKVNNLDALLEQYIAPRFLIAKTDGKAAHERVTPSEITHSNRMPSAPTPEIRWVGHEKSIKQAWLYFVIPGDKTAGDWSIKNEVFFELNDDQLNQIELVAGKTTVIHTSSLSDPQHQVTTVSSNQRSIGRSSDR